MTLKRFLRQIFVIFSMVLPLGCHRSPAFNFGAYTEAERLYEKGKYEKAIAKYQEYLEAEREGNMAVISEYYIAKSYDALGDVSKARELYEKVAKEHPDLVWAGFSRSRLTELKQESA